MLTQDDFNLKAVEISKKYRAICYENNRHWKGVWRNSYTEAFNDADLHRYGNHGVNQFHDVKIVEQVYSEASIE
jgi:hypothetical protein